MACRQNEDENSCILRLLILLVHLPQWVRAVNAQITSGFYARFKRETNSNLTKQNVVKRLSHMREMVRGDREPAEYLTKGELATQWKYAHRFFKRIYDSHPRVALGNSNNEIKDGKMWSDEDCEFSWDDFFTREDMYCWLQTWNAPLTDEEVLHEWMNGWNEEEEDDSSTGQGEQDNSDENLFDGGDGMELAARDSTIEDNRNEDGDGLINGNNGGLNTDERETQKIEKMEEKGTANVEQNKNTPVMQKIAKKLAKGKRIAEELIQEHAAGAAGFAAGVAVAHIV